MSECITCIGWDVHKETLAVVLAGGAGVAWCAGMDRLRIHLQP